MANGKYIDDIVHSINSIELDGKRKKRGEDEQKKK